MKINLSVTPKEIASGDDHQVIIFDGEFDKAGHNFVRDQLSKLVQDFTGKTLVFDFTNLKFINSEGIGYLMEIHTHLVQRGRELAIFGLKDHIADVFQTIGISEVIPVFKDLDDFISR